MKKRTLQELRDYIAQLEWVVDEQQKRIIMLKTALSEERTYRRRHTDGK